MILVVALNPALDVTHRLGQVDWAGVNRPVAVHAAPGGKGVNVARLLRALGDEVLLTGLAGGYAGNEVTAALRDSHLAAVFAGIAGQTRRTFAVVDTGRAETAIFNEPGPTVSAAEYAAFRGLFADALPASSAVVLSGSLPPGIPARAYAELITMAAEVGVPALLDTSGEPLRHGVAAGPAIVKPNLAELEELTRQSLRAGGGGDRSRPRDGSQPAEGRDAADFGAVAAAADGLRGQGAVAVVVTLGAAGLLAVTGAGCWHASTQPVSGNPTGAGDAVAAALARGLAARPARNLSGPTVGQPERQGQPADGRPDRQGKPADGWPERLGQPADGWPERLGQAAALGAAAVAAPVAGEFDPAAYQRALAGVRVTQCEQLPWR